MIRPNISDENSQTLHDFDISVPIYQSTEISPQVIKK